MTADDRIVLSQGVVRPGMAPQPQHWGPAPSYAHAAPLPAGANTLGDVDVATPERWASMTVAATTFEMELQPLVSSSLSPEVEQLLEAIRSTRLLNDTVHA